MDAGYEAFLTLAPNGQNLNFAGYCHAYPFAGPDVSIIAGGNGNWHGIAEVDAYGYYTLSLTNTSLYSAGNHQVHGAVDIDGNGTKFYSTGKAGSGYGIKDLTTSFEPASGNGIASVAGTFEGTRVAQIINGNLAFSDGSASPAGIYACSGLPTGTAGSTVMIAEGNSPMDFAASPDLNTVYIADNGTFGGTSVQAGGIQRWDMVRGNYVYSYTLGTGNGSTVGARGLAVDFSAAGTWGAGVTGAKLYATTAESSGNRLLQIVDTGAASGATVLATVGSSQILAGIRFGPVVVPPSLASQPQPALPIVVQPRPSPPAPSAAARLPTNGISKPTAPAAFTPSASPLTPATPFRLSAAPTWGVIMCWLLVRMGRPRKAQPRRCPWRHRRVSLRKPISVRVSGFNSTSLERLGMIIQYGHPPTSRSNHLRGHGPR